LNGNAIGPQGCIDVANALIKNGVLTSLEMNGNSIGDDGCMAMAATFRQNTVLTKISLNGNRIGPTGSIALTEMLRTNASLRVLGLGGNDVGNEGAVAFAGALRINAMLERLDLEGNDISDGGAMAILKALMESNCSLRWLNLKANAEISPGSHKDIDFVLASRRILKAFCKCLCKPLDKKLIPSVIHGVQLTSTHESAELVHSQETTAGPVFLLVRATALHDSKVIKAAPPLKLLSS
jgi:Leucine Rich repeat